MAVGVAVGRAYAGVGLASGKQPLEVAFEPGDEVQAQLGFVGQGLFGFGLAFEDALAQGVVQVAYFGKAVGFAIF